MEILMNIYVFILGIVFGSFFNVCIFRIPLNQSIVNPPSHCTNCKIRLKPKDLVPIFSYLFFCGRCRYCKREISIRYPLVESLTGIIFLMIYNTYSFSIETIYCLFLVSILIIITFIDIDNYIIPDGLLMIGVAFIVIFNCSFEVLTIKESIKGALLCGGGVLLLIITIESIMKKEVMGRGDVKLFALIGLSLGTINGLLVVLLSVYIGAIFAMISILFSTIKQKEINKVIPYGPFISIATLIVLLKGSELINWYMKIFYIISIKSI